MVLLLIVSSLINQRQIEFRPQDLVEVKVKGSNISLFPLNIIIISKKPEDSASSLLSLGGKLTNPQNNSVFFRNTIFTFLTEQQFFMKTGVKIKNNAVFYAYTFYSNAELESFKKTYDLVTESEFRFLGKPARLCKLTNGYNALLFLKGVEYKCILHPQESGRNGDNCKLCGMKLEPSEGYK